MVDYFEIDFLDVEAAKSGDAICVRYKIGEDVYIHVVDGGFQATGDKVVNHVKKYYGDTSFIDHVVVSHNDGDHAGGLRTVLEEFDVGALWMLRPWLYAAELIDRFSRYSNVENLEDHLRDVYANLAALEEIVERRGIPIYEPFQGNAVGAFRIMAPTRERYLDLVVASDKTPDAVEEEARNSQSLGAILSQAAGRIMSFVRAIWGEEHFPKDETSAENEMSVVQYADLCGKKILLTADAGRAGLKEFIEYAPIAGISLPGIDRFQTPHHGSRRNVSSELLDAILGPRLLSKLENGKFSAIISSAKADKDHPRKAVLRALYHRGAQVVTTESNSICTGQNAPERGWVSATPVPYPEDQEE